MFMFLLMFTFLYKIVFMALSYFLVGYGRLPKLSRLFGWEVQFIAAYFR